MKRNQFPSGLEFSSIVYILIAWSGTDREDGWYKIIFSKHLRNSLTGSGDKGIFQSAYIILYRDLLLES